MTTVTNEKGEQYSFGRNVNGSIISETGFDGLHRKYQRSPVGRVLRTERPGKRFTEYDYDNNGQLIRAEYSDGTWETYGYNKDGLLTEAINQHSTIKFERDDAGRVTKEWQDGYWVESRHDKFGRRTNIASSLGAAIDLELYITNGQVRSISAAQSDGEKWEAQMRYNSLGLEVERLMTGGQLAPGMAWSASPGTGGHLAAEQDGQLQRNLQSRVALL